MQVDSFLPSSEAYLITETDTVQINKDNPEAILSNLSTGVLELLIQDPSFNCFNFVEYTETELIMENFTLIK